MDKACGIYEHAVERHAQLQCAIVRMTNGKVQVIERDKNMNGGGEIDNITDKEQA